jgi:hypothetical protein
MGRFKTDSVAEQIYRAFTRKNSVYVSVIMVGSVFMEKVRISIKPSNFTAYDHFH